MEPSWIIAHLGMQPHPEGGHYVETFRDLGDAGGRGAASCIHFLLQAGERSAWHRIDALEIWHFAAGEPLELSWSEDGETTTSCRLGPDLADGQRPHLVIPALCWQAALPLGRWSLVSCIVAPAFSFDGFELAAPDWKPAPSLREQV